MTKSLSQSVDLVMWFILFLKYITHFGNSDCEVAQVEQNQNHNQTRNQIEKQMSIKGDA